MVNGRRGLERLTRGAVTRATAAGGRPCSIYCARRRGQEIRCSGPTATESARGRDNRRRKIDANGARGFGR